MTYEQVKNLKPEYFKHLCGVRPETFNQMVEVVTLFLAVKKENRTTWEIKLGRPSVNDFRILKRYRTPVHIGQSWGINESTAYRIIRKIEDILVNSRTFTLPGKKKLQKSDCQVEVVVVDVTETAIERPKKSKNDSTAVKRNGIRSNHR
ncbi:helix-turn-helix domain-containing protein [Aliterella atlantica]|uniref:helix-turn-helix domain-containing protein n=1 Tax=Aliterella atlantica TaxID=1827278 RepID=UPI001364AC4B|nr:transposase family protein [Aliterella atlantica]